MIREDKNTSSSCYFGLESHCEIHPLWSCRAIQNQNEKMYFLVVGSYVSDP
jgi:hypothetical protein